MRTFITLLSVVLIALPSWVMAGDDGEHGGRHDDDHDRARRAREQGQILPLRDILERAEAAYPGQLIEAELDDEHGGLVYELKVLTADGRILKLYYDAATGELLRMKGRETHR